MKWVLVLLAIGGTGDAGVKAGLAVGEYDTRDGCAAVAKIAIQDGFKPYCYPVGDVPLKTPDAAPKADPKTDKETPKKK